MKKSIIYLGIAFISFTAVAQSTSLNSISKTENVQFDYSNTTPLHFAIYQEEMDFIKKLVKYGVDVNQEFQGLTPLMIAARYNKVEVIKFLLSKGASLNHKNELGLSAIKYAEISNAKEALVYLQLSKSNPVAVR